MQVRILSVAPAHSDSDLLLWLPEERVIFCGDVVFSGGGVVAYSEVGMRLWAKALDRIIELNPRIIVPGHGGLCDVEHIKELRHYFDDVLDGFDKYYDPDLDSLEIAKKIDVAKYINWLQPERLVTIINALWRGKKGLPQSADIENTIPKLTKLREFYSEKYRDIIKPWDPMCSWKP
jgi:glyoxylase-like metal-dependent hydrolase (beta-lactamase superfamily II)